MPMELEQSDGDPVATRRGHLPGGTASQRTGDSVVLEAVRRFWDDDATTYDRAPGHAPRNAAVLGAWRAVLARNLPPAPARVLDVGAGTGFLSLLAASLGHRVTALDLSPGMLGKLAEHAESARLQIDTVVAPADDPPGGFDAVMERHVLWTLPDPGRALGAWRAAAPYGTLLAVESVWGRADPLEALRSRARRFQHRLRRLPPDHHGEYDPALRRSLPFGAGTPPAAVLAQVEAAGWPAPRMERLRDVEWAESLELGLMERVFGVTPRFCVAAGAAVSVHGDVPGAATGV